MLLILVLRVNFFQTKTFYVNYQYDHNNDKESIVDVPTSIADLFNSYNRHVNTNRYTAGMRYNYFLYRNDKDRWKINVDIPFTLLHKSTDYSRYTLDTCLVQTPKYMEPSFSISKEVWEAGKVYFGGSDNEIAFSTSLKYTVPDAMQLITLPVTSDRINIRRGNANLKSASVWKSNFEWCFPTKQKRAYIHQNINYNKYINRIINSYSYDASTGVYSHTPININGTWDMSYSGNGRHYFKIAKHNITFNWTLNAKYSEMSNYVTNGIDNMTKKISNNELYMSLPLRFRTNIANRVFVFLQGKAEWKKPLNNLSYSDYSDTWSYSGDLNLSTELFAGIDFETDFVVTKRSGYADDELNKIMYEWDIDISRSFLSKKLCLKLSAVDILHHYKGIAYMTNEQGIRETHAVSLPGYVLFTASYRFNKNPKKKK